MEFANVIASRRAIRSYRKDSVPDPILYRLFQAMQMAPSGNNRQPYQFIFVKDPLQRQKIASQACHQEFLLDAPILMAACCERGKSFDTAIAVEHLVLAATNEGLGTCWIGWFEREIVREILNVPEELDIPILVSIGYTDESPAPKPRKSIEELIVFDRYGTNKF